MPREEGRGCRFASMGDAETNVFLQSLQNMVYKQAAVACPASPIWLLMLCLDPFKRP